MLLKLPNDFSSPVLTAFDSITALLLFFNFHIPVSEKDVVFFLTASTPRWKIHILSYWTHTHDLDNESYNSGRTDAYKSERLIFFG